MWIPRIGKNDWKMVVMICCDQLLAVDCLQQVLNIAMTDRFPLQKERQ